MRLARNLQAGEIDFSGSSNDIDVEKLIIEKPLREANSVSSRITRAKFTSTPDDPLMFTGYAPTGMHKVVIDLDMDAALIPTSTPGHHHLIIDRELSWPQYRNLLDVLVKVGIIEPGYHNASIQRGASWIRVPWVKKEGTQ